MRLTAAGCAGALILAGYLAARAAAAEQLPDGVDNTTGFRMGHYRAPVPNFIPGGKIIGTDEVKALADGRKVILVDVYPPKGAGPDPLDGTWRNTETRRNIPGSIWLPDVGRGYLEADLEDYFRINLEKLSTGRKDTAIVFYCTADCWQSWNAARRAIVWGYTNVHWYPQGTDGWVEENLPVEVSEPVNFLEGRE